MNNIIKITPNGSPTRVQEIIYPVSGSSALKQGSVSKPLLKILEAVDLENTFPVAENPISDPTRKNKTVLTGRIPPAKEQIAGGSGGNNNNITKKKETSQTNENAFPLIIFAAAGSSLIAFLTHLESKEVFGSVTKYLRVPITVVSILLWTIATAIGLTPNKDITSKSSSDTINYHLRRTSH